MAGANVEVSYTLDQAYVVKPEDLAKINTAVRDYLDSNAEVIFEATCSDDTTRPFKDVTALKKYENAVEGSIVSLRISGVSADRNKSVTVQFDRGELFFPAIRVRMSGTEASTRTLRKKLGDAVTGMTPWYAWVVRMNLVGCLFVVMFWIWFVVYGLSLVYFYSKGRLGEAFKFDMGAFTVTFLGTGLLILIASKLNEWKNQLFPKGVFAIGQGAARDDRLAGIRNIILVVVALGVIIGIVGGLLTNVIWSWVA